MPIKWLEAGAEGGVPLTLIKVRHGRLTLHLVLLLGILLVYIVSLHVVPGVELEGIVALFEVAGAKLERVAPLLVELRVVGSVGRQCLALSDFERRDVCGQLVLRVSSPNLRL